MNTPDPMSHKHVLHASDEYWENRLRAADEAGGMYVIAYAMCALSGAVVGLAVGLLLG